MPPPRPLQLLLVVAAVALPWSAACVAAQQDTFLPPSPFPFCPTRPAGVSSTMPFPWSSPPPPPPVTVYPQDPGYFPSEAVRVGCRGAAAAWFPLASVISSFVSILLQ